MKFVKDSKKFGVNLIEQNVKLLATAIEIIFIVLLFKE
jgi:hypothetical protein